MLHKKENIQHGLEDQYYPHSRPLKICGLPLKNMMIMVLALSIVNADLKVKWSLIRANI